MAEKSGTDQILDFWFGELQPEAWFTRNEAVDRTIAERFADLHHRLAGAVPQEAFEQPRAALAAIILFDQFPRNMFRGTPRAFETDDLAAQLSRNALDNGFDQDFGQAEKQFLFMPLMHSEVLGDQERCVMLFEGLGDEESLRYAVDHRNIIARFGRFPHRNSILGREATPDEAAFLEVDSFRG